MMELTRNHTAQNATGRSDISVENNINILLTRTTERIFKRDMMVEGTIKSKLIFIQLINFVYHLFFGLLSINNILSIPL